MGARLALFPALILGTAVCAETPATCADQLRLWERGTPIEFATAEETGDGFCEATDVVIPSFLGAETAERIRWRISDGILYGTSVAADSVRESLDIQLVGFSGGLWASRARLDLDFSMNWDGEAGQVTVDLREFRHVGENLTFTSTVGATFGVTPGLTLQDQVSFDEASLQSLALTLKATGDCTESNEGWGDALRELEAEGLDLGAYVAGLPEATFDAESKAVLSGVIAALTVENSSVCPSPIAVRMTGTPIPLFGDWMADGLPDPATLEAIFDGVIIEVREHAE